MYKFKEEKMIVPCYVWSEKGKIEQGAIDQIKNVSSLPFVFNHTSLMPDAHQGFGICIGGVVATENVISPAMVGVDIGCGMCAVKTSLTEIDKDTLKKIMSEIRKVIPLGRNHHKEAQDTSLMPKSKWLEWGDSEVGVAVRGDMLSSICAREYRSALKQIGTLGGGNHFIEIQKGSDGYIWIMIHSGSRNIGLKVAEHYSKLAYDLNVKWHAKTFLPSNWKDSLAFFPVDSEEGQNYLMEMNYCVDFALANRKLMMERIIDCFPFPVGFNPKIEYNKNLDDPNKMINIAHNYAKQENHFGVNVWVHRKGATLATEDTVGIIPGSQGTKSYIVKGKGNRDAFNSCSHGAGRILGRNQARIKLDLETEKKKLNDLGIIHSIRSVSDLDEAAGAYKPIDEVMANQSDLVEILVELSPLAVIKA